MVAKGNNHRYCERCKPEVRKGWLQARNKFGSRSGARPTPPAWLWLELERILGKEEAERIHSVYKVKMQEYREANSLC